MKKYQVVLQFISYKTYEIDAKNEDAAENFVIEHYQEMLPAEDDTSDDFYSIESICEIEE